MNETAEVPHDRYTYRQATVSTTSEEYHWLKKMSAKRSRILLAGVHEGREAGAMTELVGGFVAGCCDFGLHFSPHVAEQIFVYATKGNTNAIINRKLRLKIGKLHTIPDSELADQFDMFVLNQPYESADEAARDIQRGISLCQPAALICGTCYNNPATKEAVDARLPFRQLFGNIWFGYL